AMDALSGEIHASTQAGLLESSSQVRDATQRRLLAPEGNGFWLEPLGGKLEQDGNDNAAGFDSDDRGLLAGIDGELDNGWRLGAFAGSSRGDVEVSRRAASANTDSLHAGVYAVKHWDQVTLQLGLSNSWHDVE